MSFRILSIDGGGIRGIVAARMLEVIEQQLNQPLREYFDLITGTSTGALIAASLMIGHSATQLVDLYLNRGKEIFPYRSWRSGLNSGRSVTRTRPPICECLPRPQQIY